MKHIAITRLELIDCVPLRDSDASGPGFYVAACGINADRRHWRGCVVVRSLDGITFNDPVAIIRRPSIIGAVVSADSPGSVVVKLFNDAPVTSNTPLAIQRGGNLCVIGNTVAQFMTATLVAPGTYRLTMVTTARVPTAGSTIEATVGERFVYVSPTVEHVMMNADLLGHELLYVAQTHGSPFIQGTRTRFTCNAEWRNV